MLPFNAYSAKSETANAEQLKTLHELNGGHWTYSWAWGLPLIVLTVMVHSLALFATRNRLVAALANSYSDESFSFRFALTVGAVVLFVTTLLAVEATLWAVVYVLIGAVSDLAHGMLYSLEALTTFGHADLYLAPRWQFLGALEALNGVILIGLSTAFIFAVLQGAQVRKTKAP